MWTGVWNGRLADGIDAHGPSVRSNSEFRTARAEKKRARLLGFVLLRAEHGNLLGFVLPQNSRPQEPVRKPPAAPHANTPA